MDKLQFTDVAVSVLGALGLLVGKELISILRDLNKGVDALNTKIAVVIERVDTHETRITNLEDK